MACSRNIHIQKYLHCWAVVLAQLSKRSLPIPEVRSSNPVIGKVFIEYFVLSTVMKRRNKEKESGDGPFFKI